MLVKAASAQKGMIEVGRALIKLYKEGKKKKQRKKEKTKREAREEVRYAPTAAGESRAVPQLEYTAGKDNGNETGTNGDKAQKAQRREEVVFVFLFEKNETRVLSRHSFSALEWAMRLLLKWDEEEHEGNGREKMGGNVRDRGRGKRRGDEGGSERGNTHWSRESMGCDVVGAHSDSTRARC